MKVPDGVKHLVAVNLSLIAEPAAFDVISTFAVEVEINGVAVRCVKFSNMAQASVVLKRELRRARIQVPHVGDQQTCRILVLLPDEILEQPVRDSHD